MGESGELEEGEMDCSTDEVIVDLDVDLLHINKKLQNVLGDLQKKFEEGGLNMFGPKIFDYGSFLPTYKHPPTIPSFQRNPLGNRVVQRVPNNLPAKNAVEKFQSLPTASCKLAGNQESQNCQTSGSVLAQAPGKVTIKNGNARVPGNGLSDHKPIRVRIKMGSEILSRKVTVVCNDSPKSPVEKTNESPYRILQEMTAIPIPEYLLMSPLPDSLLLVKDKERRYTLLGNEPLVKPQKESSVKTQNKFPDILSCEETPIGRKRKAVDCVDGAIWNETSSVGETKKQKVISTSQLAKGNSVSSLGGAGSIYDGIMRKSNLQKGIKKDGKSGPGVSFANSNKMKVVGKHNEKEKMKYPTKLEQSSTKNRSGDKSLLSKMPLKDPVHIGQDSMGSGVDFVVAPSATGLDLDSWALCDSCETWRLLPFGMKTEQLPEKWLCSMQTWLPEMNHCGVSMEATTNAIKSFRVTEAHTSETGVEPIYVAGNAAKSHQPLTSGLLPNLTAKKSTVKDLPHGVSSNRLVDVAKPMRSSSHVFKIKNMKRPLETTNATQICIDLGLSNNIDQDKIDQKAKWQSTGTGSQIKIKKKKEGGEQGVESLKQIKIGDGNRLFKDVKAERKTKRRDNDFHVSDVEHDTEERLPASKRKPDHKLQPTTGSGSVCAEAHGRINIPVGKIRLMGYKQAISENNSKSFAAGEETEASIGKKITTKISVEEIKARQRNKLFQADGSREHRYVEELPILSPVESVSSYPGRSSYPKTLASGGESVSRKSQNLQSGDTGGRVVINRKPLCLEADREILLTTHSRNSIQPKSEVCEQSSKCGDLPFTSVNTLLGNRTGIENLSAITHEKIDRSLQGANDVLQEAEKLRKFADCLKISGFDREHKESNFTAALKFLLGASLLEMCNTENVERGKMSHVEAYHTAAKLSESCAQQYETSQEMAVAALAYKCVEVSYMRVVYGRSVGLSGEWTELQKSVQMTPQGESPSSSASDVDSFNHQAVIGKSATTERGVSHVTGNLVPFARSQQSCVQLLDITGIMSLAMEASAKSRNAFRAASVISEETQPGNYVSAIKKVVDFSFHDVETLIQMIALAMNVLRPSRFHGPKC